MKASFAAGRGVEGVVIQRMEYYANSEYNTYTGKRGRERT